MLNTRKRAATLLAAVGVAAAVGIGSFAYAAFTQDAESDAIAARTETFKNLVVTGDPEDKSLWPGQTTDVTLTISNVANDTDIVVTEAMHVAPVGADVDPLVATDKTYCKNQLELNDFKKIPAELGAVKGGQSRDVVLPDALTLKSDTDNRCQNMTFRVKWTVSADTAYSKA
jgi:hypothetical protein